MPNIHNKTYVTGQLASIVTADHAFAIDSSDVVTETATVAEIPPVQTNASTSTSGGTLANTAQFFYVITAVDAHNNETQVSNEKSVTTGTGSNSNTANWTNPSGTVFNKIYRSLTTGTEVFLVKIPVALTYVDTGAIAPTAGQTPPATAAVGPPVVHAGIGAARGDDAKAQACLMLVSDVGHRSKPVFH